MVVRLNEISSKEDRPRFVSRKQRARLRAEFESTAAPPPAVKRAKVDSEPEVTEDQTQYPSWRLAKEKQLNSEERKKAGNEFAEHRKWFEKTRSEMSERDWRIMRTDLQISCTSLPGLQPLLHWQELPDKELGNRLATSAYKKPTPVQRATIPIALEGTDVIGIAQTGSGKTLSFTVPLILSNALQSLVLAPTRELALQITTVINEFAHLKDAHVVSLVGGREFADQHEDILTAGSHSAVIFVATPGRLLDFTRQKLLDLSDCTYLIMDEADRMIDLGFEEQISEIMGLLPENRQTLMYTATWPRQIQELAAKFSKKGAVKIQIGATRRSTTVQQSAELIDSQAHKLRRLTDLVRRAHPPAIVFVATKAECESIAPQVESALPLHGSMSQEKREATISALREGTIKCIVATDVASRGLDVPDVSLVVNFDMPSDIDTYIHRIGRTGRAGRNGKAVTLCLEKDAGLFKDLRRVFRESGSPVPQFLL